jgi:hypothetical protein
MVRLAEIRAELHQIPNAAFEHTHYEFRLQ